MTKQFAEIDSENRVIQILEVDDADVDNYGGDQSQTAVDHVSSFLSLHSPRNRWVQTSINHSFRRRYASIGGTYDPQNDVFIDAKPYDDFVFNSQTFSWDPPIPYPTTQILSIYWDVKIKKWAGLDGDQTDSPKLFWDENELVWKNYLDYYPL
jgi:hypothetical protein